MPRCSTSPTDDLEGILQASGARLFLVGAPDVLARVGEMCTQVPIPSFLPGPLPAGLDGRVIPWEAFLALGRNAGPPQAAATAATAARPAAREAPVGFPDPAPPVMATLSMVCLGMVS